MSNSPPLPDAAPVIGPAPADARPHPPWPLWKKVLAYALLAALASAAIWYIDAKARGPMENEPPDHVGRR